jgi:hypothetical protein
MTERERSTAADGGRREPRAREAPNGPPPRWDGADDPRQRREEPDLSALAAVVESLRTAVPREVQDQFISLQRELLLTIRALIDWYLERLEASRRPPPAVEDIPIE